MKQGDLVKLHEKQVYLGGTVPVWNRKEAFDFKATSTRFGPCDIGFVLKTDGTWVRVIVNGSIGWIDKFYISILYKGV
jgi:hypothetical protein